MKTKERKLGSAGRWAAGVTVVALSGGIKLDYNNLPMDTNSPVFYINDWTVQVHVEPLHQAERGLTLGNEADFVGDILVLVALAPNFEEKAAIFGYVHREEYLAWRQTGQTSTTFPSELLFPINALLNPRNSGAECLDIQQIPYLGYREFRGISLGSLYTLDNYLLYATEQLQAKHWQFRIEDPYVCFHLRPDGHFYIVNVDDDNDSKPLSESIQRQYRVQSLAPLSGEDMDVFALKRPLKSEVRVVVEESNIAASQGVPLKGVLPKNERGHLVGRRGKTAKVKSIVFPGSGLCFRDLSSLTADIAALAFVSRTADGDNAGVAGWLWREEFLTLCEPVDFGFGRRYRVPVERLRDPIELKDVF